ncbi:MAG: hypothetical protein ABIQ02_12410 [Saprospiraceae bacterium]
MKRISYSELLTEFIDPLLDGKETESTYLDKAVIGMVAWNYHVAKSADSPFLKHVEEVYLDFRKKKINGSAIMDKLLKRKETMFRQYAQFFVRVDTRPGKDRTPVLHVEYLPIEMLPLFVAEMEQGDPGDILKGKLTLRPISF